MSKISVSVDNDKVNQGDFFTVDWKCENPDMVVLNVQDGTRSSIPLADSGSRVIRASGESDRITLTLVATIAGKKEEVTKVVRVVRPKAHKVEKVDYIPRSDDRAGKTGTASRFGRKPFFDTGKLKTYFANRSSVLKTAWSLLPADKKVIVEILLILFGIEVVSIFVPKVLPFGILLLGLYLIYKLFRTPMRWR